MTITVEAGEDGAVLRFVRTTGRRKEILDVSIYREKLAAARRDLAGGLERFVNAVGDRLWHTGRPNSLNVENALRDLHYSMYALGEGVMRDGVDGMSKVRRFFDHPYGWWKNPAARIRVVEVSAAAADFPLELLPVFDHGRFDGGPDRIALMSACRRFLGFTCAVRRNAGSRVGSGRNLQGTPLAISVIRHAGLRGSVFEGKFLSSVAGCLLVDGPWPEAGLAREVVVDAVTDALFDGRRQLTERDGNGPTQIHHFACHCHTSSGPTSSYALIIAGEPHVDVHIHLREISAGYGQRVQDLERQRRGNADAGDRDERALVFLNACGSAFIAPERVTSFPRFFLDNRHRGVIGCETVIPDSVAARFATSFYRLLLAGRSVGVALVKSRLYVLERYGNPLGLLYAMYADPDIRIETPVPEEKIWHPCFEV